MSAEPQVVPTVNQLLHYHTPNIYITPAVMQWHGSNNRTLSLNMAWLNQSDHMRRRLDAASVKHPNGCCRESGFEPRDDTLEQIRIRSPSDKLIFWSWLLISRFPALRLEAKKKRGKNLHIIISMIMSISRWFCGSHGTLWSGLFIHLHCILLPRYNNLNIINMD